MRDNLYLALLAVFVPMSLLSVGGGQAVIPEIHREVVLGHHWIDEATFVADYAISRMSPGPSSLIVALIGWQVAGWLGALLATIAIFLPSSLLMYLLVRVWARHRGAVWQKAMERGLAPVAAGLILASCATLLRAASGGWLVPVVGVVSAIVLLSREEISPVVLLAGGAAIFLLIGS
jgi:chromate transporter